MVRCRAGWGVHGRGWKSKQREGTRRAWPSRAVRRGAARRGVARPAPRSTSRYAVVVKCGGFWFVGGGGSFCVTRPLRPVLFVVSGRRARPRCHHEGPRAVCACCGSHPKARRGPVPGRRRACSAIASMPSSSSSPGPRRPRRIRKPARTHACFSLRQWHGALDEAADLDLARLVVETERLLHRQTQGGAQLGA